MPNSNKKLPYKKPEFNFFPAKELDTIQAMMSGGSGGGGTIVIRRPEYPAVYLIFSPIELEGVSVGIDHAAFIIETSDGGGYYYSFATDSDYLVSLVTGCDGYMSTAVDENSHNEKIININEFLYNSRYRVIEDKKDFNNDDDTVEDGISYGQISNYYRYIRFEIDESINGDTTAEAVLSRARAIRRSNNTSPRQYSLLWSNCCDCALHCFNASSLYPLTIEYDNSRSISFVESAISAMLLSPIHALQTLAIALQVSILIEGIPTIPNIVYEEIENAYVGSTEISWSRGNM